MSAPNLDSMTTEDLYDFTSTYRGISSRAKAARLFPDNPAGRIKAMRDLVNYAWNTITARTCRERGDVQTALHYEAIAQRIYDALPEWARW